MTFKSWVKQSKYTKEDTAVGDLARTIAIDKDFPKTIEKHIISEYLPDDDNIQKLFNRLYSYFICFISRDYSDE